MNTSAAENRFPLKCSKCNSGVPSYLFAINRNNGSIIWVNGHAKTIACERCGEDLRKTALKQF